ncbi:MAG: cytochrome c3 family protein [Deltaproteobacteria bacterium]|nr:cytochrome c3 family protein [Deltaproteobacteria bacterium]
MTRYLFPRWSNHVLRWVVFFGLGPLATAVVVALWYYGTNKHLEVGYQPVQPVDYSHKLHAGDLGMDCRYCHSTVERAAFAAIPPTQTCMNCHSRVLPDSQKLLPVRESFAFDKPIAWVRVHKLPEFVYFDHAAHLSAGVGCSSCHGRVDQMVTVIQREPLSMSWCLDCHRDPGRNLRPDGDVTNMKWQPPDGSPAKALAPNGREVQPPVHCSGCHR